MIDNGKAFYETIADDAKHIGRGFVDRNEDFVSVKVTEMLDHLA